MTASTGNADFLASWDAWRERREAALTNRHGFLAITSINWLTDTPQRLDDAPGEWHADADGVHVSLGDGEQLEADGRPITGTHHFGVIAEDHDVKVGWGDAVIEVAMRGGSPIVRPRHPNSAVLAGYRSTPRYAPSTRWVVQGRFVPYAEVRTVVGGSVVDGLMLEHRSPGVVEFHIDGVEYTLVVFTDSEPDGDDLDLYALLTDGTSGITTYRACRMLDVGVPNGDGSVTLDFNRASNLPCAYTTMATCPLPPPENRLRLPIEAGEMVPLPR